MRLLTAIVSRARLLSASLFNRKTNSSHGSHEEVGGLVTFGDVVYRVEDKDAGDAGIPHLRWTGVVGPLCAGCGGILQLLDDTQELARRCCCENPHCSFGMVTLPADNNDLKRTAVAEVSARFKQLLRTGKNPYLDPSQPLTQPARVMGQEA